MSQKNAIRLASRLSSAVRPNVILPRSRILNATRSVSTTIKRPNKDDPYHKSSTAATGTSAGPHEGSSSRTDNQIRVEYPDAEDFPREQAVQGRGG